MENLRAQAGPPVKPSESSPLATLSETASRLPDTLALRCFDGEITFSELEARVSQIVSALQSRWAAEDLTLLAVPVDYSLDSQVVALSLLCAGRPFCVLDAELEQAALESQIEAVDQDATLLWPSEILGWATKQVPHFTDVPLNNTSLVLLSSGTTGKPKAVVHSWSTILPRLHLRSRMFGLPVETLVSATCAPIHFSFGFFLMATVLIGTQVVLGNPHIEGLPSMFQRFVGAGMNRLTLSSEIANALSRAIWGKGSHQLISVLELTGGRVSPGNLSGLIDWCRADALLVSSYSSTEAMGIMEAIVPVTDLLDEGTVGVGVPRESNQVKLSPIAGMPDVFGVEVSGDIALGYWKNPELNSEKFYRDSRGVRWWRSGDLVRRVPDGTYTHLGRVDDLVKIRGNSVSVGAVEKDIERVPGISQAVVIVSGDGIHAWLDAHCVVDLPPQESREATIARIAGLISPRHHPRRFFFHDSFPLTSRGKVDRRALAKMGQSHSDPLDSESTGSGGADS